MKALTLWNPWAVLASLGLKGWETRSWYPPHSLDGQYFAIHGALTMPRAARDFANDPAVADALRPHFPHLYVWQERKAPAMGYWRYFTNYRSQGFPTGVLAVARLGPVVRTTEARVSDLERRFGIYDPGRWALKLDDVRALSQPVPCAGRQRFWNLSPDVEELVLERVRLVA